MKAIKVNHNEIISNTVKFAVEESMEIMTSISKSLMIETLKKRMLAGEVVKFCYLKLDNTIRFACGTLQSNSVEANIKGCGLPKKLYGQFAYIDSQKLQWRSFCMSRIIGIID